MPDDLGSGRESRLSHRGGGRHALLGGAQAPVVSGGRGRRPPARSPGVAEGAPWARRRITLVAEVQYFSAPFVSMHFSRSRLHRDGYTATVEGRSVGKTIRRRVHPPEVRAGGAGGKQRGHRLHGSAGCRAQPERPRTLSTYVSISGARRRADRSPFAARRKARRRLTHGRASRYREERVRPPVTCPRCGPASPGRGRSSASRIEALPGHGPFCTPRPSTRWTRATTPTLLLPRGPAPRRRASRSRRWGGPARRRGPTSSRSSSPKRGSHLRAGGKLVSSELCATVLVTEELRASAVTVSLVRRAGGI